MIPTINRTDRLAKVITDINGNAEKYNYNKTRIEIIVVDDGREETSLEKNREMLEEMKIKTGLKIKYYGRDLQIEFLKKLKEISRVDPEEFIYINKNEGKRGYGGIRNLLCMIAIFNVKNPGTVISFFDDDTSLKNVYSDNGMLKFDHVFDFFGRMDYFFLHGNMNVLGGDYTRDLFQGYWITSHMLLVLDKFFTLTRNMKPDDSSEAIKNQVLTIQNPWHKEIDVSLISANTRFPTH